MSGTVCAIAIDGPSGAGKSTVAKRVAAALSFQYIDTGAMYRALTLKALRLGIDTGDDAAVSAMARQSSVILRDEAGGTRVLLDGEDVSREIREPAVTAHVSAVCSYGGVREAMVEQQRAMAAHGPVVMDGRDIGSHVLPNAKLKIFLTADLAVRGRRRYQEWQAKGIDALSEEEICADLARRDHLDSTRALNPLRQTEDAVYLDTSALSIDQVVQAITALWEDIPCGF